MIEAHYWNDSEPELKEEDKVVVITTYVSHSNFFINIIDQGSFLAYEYVFH